MTTLSGWCTPAPGATHSNAQHETCARRMAEGLLGECSCPLHDDEAKEAS